MRKTKNLFKYPQARIALVVAAVTLLAVYGMSLLRDRVSGFDRAYSDGITIDVRSKEEYDSGHLENAMNIPLQVIKNIIEKHVMDKNAPINVYCRSGARSGAAKTTLKAMGFKKVANIGGYKAAKYAIERAMKKKK